MKMIHQRLGVRGGSGFRGSRCGFLSARGWSKKSHLTEKYTRKHGDAYHFVKDRERRGVLRLHDVGYDLVDSAGLAAAPSAAGAAFGGC